MLNVIRLQGGFFSTFILGVISLAFIWCLVMASTLFDKTSFQSPLGKDKQTVTLTVKHDGKVYTQKYEVEASLRSDGEFGQPSTTRAIE